MSGHTNGPWSTFADGLTVIAGGVVVGKFHPEPPNRANVTGTSLEEAKANARLGALAPDMLAILQDAIEIVEVAREAREYLIGEEDDVIRDLEQRIRAVIAKAEGRA